MPFIYNIGSEDIQIEFQFYWFRSLRKINYRIIQYLDNGNLFLFFADHILIILHRLVYNPSKYRFNLNKKTTVREQ